MNTDSTNHSYGGAFSRDKLAPLLAIFAKAVVALFVISVLAALYPFQPWTPLWYLKVGQIAVDYSVSLLFGLVLALMALSAAPGNKKLGISRRLVRRLSTASFVAYSTLLPIQLFSYGLHWLNTGQQTQQAVRKANSDLSSLRDRINASSNNAQLFTIIGRAPSLTSANTNPSELTEQKKRIIDSLDLSLTQLRVRLQRERRQDLTALFMSTLKGTLGAAIIAFSFFRVNRNLKLI